MVITNELPILDVSRYICLAKSQMTFDEIGSSLVITIIIILQNIYVYYKLKTKKVYQFNVFLLLTSNYLILTKTLWCKHWIL
jgi:hypothetical protein